MKRRIISMILAIVMIVGMIPAAAFTASAAEATIYVGGVELSDGDYLTSGATAVSDSAPDSGGYAHYSISGGKATLTLNNYTYSGAGSEFNSSGNVSAAAVYYGGDDTLYLTLEGENSVTHTGGSNVYDSVGISVYGDLDISGTGSLTASGGTPDPTRDSASYGIYSGYGDMTLSSGTVTANGGEAPYFSAGVLVSNVIVSGGSLTAVGNMPTDDTWNTQSHGINAFGTFTVSGGSVKASAKEASISAAVWVSVWNNENHIILGEDVSILSPADDTIGYVEEWGSHTIFDGASYATEVEISAAQAVPANVASVTTTSGTTNYTDIVAAFAAAEAENGSTLKLLDNVAVSEYIEVMGGKFTIDLNGKEFTSPTYVVRNYEGSSITLKDSVGNGKMLSTGTGASAILSHGELTVDSGYYSGGKSITPDGTALTINGGTFAKTVQFSSTSSAIKGGTFEDGAFFFTNATVDGGIFKSKIGINEAGKTVTINNGTFSNTEISMISGQIKLKGGSFTDGITIANKHTTINALLADGYCYYDANGDILTVADDATTLAGPITVGAKPHVASVTTTSGTTNYTDIAAAFAAAEAENGSTLKLLDNVAVSDIIDVKSGKFTIDLNGKTWESTATVLILSNSADVKITDSSAGTSGKMVTTTASPTILLKNTSNLEVAGGTVENADSVSVINMSFGGTPTEATLTVSGGKLVSNGSLIIWAYGKSVTVTGGTFESIYRHIDYYTGVIDLSGHSDPTGIKIANYTGASVTPSDTTVKLPTGYVFFDSFNNAVTELEHGQNYTVGTIPQYSVTVNVTGLGSVTASKDNALAGEEITLEILAENEYYLDELIVDGVDVTDNLNAYGDYVFTMPASSVTVSATFLPYIYDITVDSNITHGSITVDKNAAAKGETVKLTVAVDEGYVIAGVKYWDGTDEYEVIINGASPIREPGTYDFKMEAYDVDFRAVIIPRIFINSNISSAVIPDKSAAMAGETVTVEISLPAGYEYHKLTSLTVTDADGDPVTLNGNQFTMPDKPVTVSATFEEAALLDVTFEKGPSYDASTNTFYISETNPIVFTVKGKLMSGYVVSIDASNDEWTYGIEHFTASADDEVTYTFDINDYKTFADVMDAFGYSNTIVKIKFTFGNDDSVTVVLNVAKDDFNTSLNTVENGTVTLSNDDPLVGEEVTVNATPADGYKIDTITVTDADGDPVPVNGNKFTMPASNVTVSVTFVEKQTVSINSATQTVFFDTTAKAFEIKGTTLTGFTVKYQQNGVDVTPSAIGTYDVIITRAEDEDNKSFETTITGGLVIEYFDFDMSALDISGYFDGNVKWTNGSESVLVSVAVGYTISKEQSSAFANNVSFSAGEPLTVYVKEDATGAVTGAIDLSSYISFDGTDPEGEVTLSTGNSWTNLINKITFGFFFNEEKTVEILAADTESGISSIKYYVANEDLIKDSSTPIADLEAAVGVGWNTYSGAITLELKSKNVVYAMITDNVGNVTYVSTDGIAIYKDSTSTTTSIEYVKKSAIAPAVNITLNSNTIKEVRIGNTVLANGTDYTVSVNGDVATLSLAASKLDAINAGNHTVTVDLYPLGIVTDAVKSTITVSLTVQKAVVNAPTIGSKVYTGETLTADLAASTLYDVSANAGGIDVGEYDVVLTLKSPDDYKWSDSDESTKTLKFNITKATNTWIAEPTYGGWTYGENAVATNGAASFGSISVNYTGKTNGGADYDSATAPTEAGNYKITYTVADTNNYSGLVKEIDFTVARAAQTITVDLSNREAICTKELDARQVSAEGAVSYSVSDSTIATVDATTGKITTHNDGETTITVTAAQTDNYNEASVSYKLTVAHDHTGSWKMDRYNHWRVCTCSDIIDKEEHIPGNPATHEDNESCTVCLYILNAASGHNFAPSLGFTEHVHYNGCGCGVTENHEEHTYVQKVDEKALKSAATCAAAAVYYESCSECGSLGENTFTSGSAKDHSFTKYESNNDATCEKDGTKTAKCDNCDATDTVVDEGSAKEHSFTKYVSNNDATCEKDGTKTAKCDNCDATDTVVDEGSAKGHSFTKYERNGDATCEKDGTKTAKCDYCDVTDTQTDASTKIEHSFNGGECEFCGAEDLDHADLTWLWITVAPIAIAGGGFAIYWFVIRKKIVTKK